MLTKDTYLAIFIVLFSIGAYLATLSYPYQSAYFPRFILMLLGGLGCALFVKEIRKKKPSAPEKDADKPSIWQNSAFVKVSLMVVYSVVYLLGVSYVGFFSTSIVGIPVMIRLLGVKKPSTIIISTGIVVFFIFLIFRLFLKVPFPEGLLF
jgi:hypothetical protein